MSRFLARLDSLLAPLTWIVATVLVAMLFLGPELVAEDKPSAAPAYGVDGRAIFAQNCGRCHTLAPASTSGQVGPDLDRANLNAAAVAAIVRSGRGVMPSFSGSLNDAEIRAVAGFVASASSE